MSRLFLRRCLLGAFLLCGLLLGPAALAHTTGSPPPVIPHGAQSGDLIFRKGTEAVSDLVRSLDSDGEFSHVGILIAASELSAEFFDDTSRLHNTSWFVLHATPSEVEGRADAVVLDSLAFFLSPTLSRGHAVYRVANADAGQRRVAVTAALAQLGQPFSLTDESGTYCTELPYTAWLNAGVGLDVRFKRLAIFLFPPRDFLLPGALMASPKLERLGGD